MLWRQNSGGGQWTGTGAGDGSGRHTGIGDGRTIGDGDGSSGGSGRLREIAVIDARPAVARDDEAVGRGEARLDVEHVLRPARREDGERRGEQGSCCHSRWLTVRSEVNSGRACQMEKWNPDF